MVDVSVIGVDTVLGTMATLDEDALTRSTRWRDKPLDVRNALYLTLQEAQEALVRAAAGPHPESRRILALAQGAFGDLRGLVGGLPPELLAKAPAPGEWSVRETLRHVVLVERRYVIQTVYAVERDDADPVRIPDDRLPSPAEVDVPGEIDAILRHLAAARAETTRRLSTVPPIAMTRPTIWSKLDVDVRFRLHRFAAHLAEHTVQCEKILHALGWRPTEGRRIIRRWSTMLGELEGLGAEREVAELVRSLAEIMTAADGTP